MEQFVAIMLPAFLACLILTGIHTYLGLHVVSRGVIFVDLALAQIAALGSTFAFLIGYDPRSTAGYFYSLGFAFVGAAIFSLSRFKDNRIPQEALIGITFAVASSAAILIADRAPQGAEHVEQMLTGNILWVEYPTIWKTLAIYSAVGLFHLLFRKKFLLISMNHSEAERQGIAVRWWDFLFYMSFGFVITSSVAIAGVLLVFSFLIIPSVIGMLYSNRIGGRLVAGWISGTLVSLIGLCLSYGFDFPSGPAVVCTFGAFLILAALLRYVMLAERKAPAVWRVAGGIAAVAAALFLAVQFRPAVVDGVAAQNTPRQRIDQALQVLDSADSLDSSTAQILVDNRAALEEAIQTGDIELSQRTLQRLGESGRGEFLPALKLAYAKAADPWNQYYISLAQLDLGDKAGIHNLISLLRGDDKPVFLKSQTIAKLQESIGESFAYDPSKGDADNEKAVNRIEVWWHQNTDRLTWDPETRRFLLE